MNKQLNLTWNLTCTRCRMFGPRKGGKFYFRNGIKSFVCAACVARKQEQAA